MSPKCSTISPLSVFGPSSGNCGPEPPVERPQLRHAVHDDAAVGLAPVRLGAAGRLGGELADDLLDDVLDRDQPLELAVLVDDQPQPLAVGLELLSWVSSGVPAGTK